MQTGDVSTAELPAGDLVILQIAQDARSTLPVFFRLMARAGAAGSSYCVKYPLPASDTSGYCSEQVWLSGISFKDGTYYGTLAGIPLYQEGLKKGDTIPFSADSVTDWMYIQNGKITGGESIKYLLEKIPENSRSQEQQKILEMFERKTSRSGINTYR